MFGLTLENLQSKTVLKNCQSRVWSFWNILVRCGSFWIVLGSLWIVVDSCGSFWIILGHFGRLRVLVATNKEVSLVQQLIQVVKQNLAIVMLAVRSEYSRTCSQLNFSSEITSDKQSECILKN